VITFPWLTPSPLALDIYMALVWVCVATVILRNGVAVIQLLLAWWVARREAPPSTDFLHLWQRAEAHAPRISVIAPAFNEELSIVQSVRSLLSLQYPDLELVVVNDGSKDATAERMIETFDMVPVERVVSRALHNTRVRAFYQSKIYPNLVFVDKENGRKADAANAGISYSSGELICVIDADSVIDAEGLLRAVEPFMDSDGSVIAVGGSIRVANGCTIKDGHVVKIGTGTAWLPLFQTLEYFRAFLAGRVASAHLSMLLLISGAFGVFRREAVVAAGGYKHDTVGEDLELLVRLQRIEREAGRSHEVVYLPEICCWTEVPSSLKGVRNQRTRWQQGALETLVTHRQMLFNPRYGRLGMVAFPLLALEDFIGPIVELLGYILIIAGLVFGILDPVVALVYLLLTCVFGSVMSTGALMLEEQQLRPTSSPRDLAWLLAAAVLENFGFRQLIQYYRLRGLYHFLRGNEMWAAVPRTGFNNTPTRAAAPANERRKQNLSIAGRVEPTEV
jgi:cellulose synthase/poly-beta-1,6-N-acetylglucosamine synthase-like glycosyltransferase